MIEHRLPTTNMSVPVQSVCGRVNCEPQIEWSRVRRARPLDQLLPGTLHWAESFPLETPVHLVRTFPRVANRLAIAWQDPNAVQEVLDDVLIDRRGGRRGFPPPVQQELLRLRAFNLGRRSGQSGRLPVSRAVR